MPSNVEKLKIKINPTILRWAREQSGYSIDEVAKTLKKEPDSIGRWEETSGPSPTVKQARTLADLYGRSFTEFFRSTPPPIVEPSLVPDFRIRRSAMGSTERHALRNLQLWAEAQRENALSLYEEIGEAPPTLPDALSGTLSENPEHAADRAREAVAFPLEEQIDLKRSKKYLLPSIFRRKIEASGILVLKRTDIADHSISGICVIAETLPLIIFGNESPGAQMFTLAHELAHVMIRQSAVVSPGTEPSAIGNGAKVERWCDAFAAAFLMPRHAIHGEFGVPPDRIPESMDRNLLDAMAMRFGVSRHALLIRLTQLGYVDPDFYWKVMRPKFIAQEADYRQFGRSDYYGSRYRNALGDLYTGLVIEAWSSGRITNHNAAEYMGIKNLRHLTEIKEHYFST